MVLISTVSSILYQAFTMEGYVISLKYNSIAFIAYYIAVSHAYPYF